jgi:hypothetical protein
VVGRKTERILPSIGSLALISCLASVETEASAQSPARRYSTSQARTTAETDRAKTASVISYSPA